MDVVRAWATHSIGSNGSVIAETIGALVGVGLASALLKISHRTPVEPVPPTER